MRKNVVPLRGALCVALLAALVLSGCLPGAKAPLLIEQYTLEYTSPSLGGTPPTNEAIRIDRFSVAQSYNSTAMVYKPAPYRLASYNANRWRVNPADIVTDYLSRDLRNSGAFQGVFSYRNAENTRFVLEGGVEEFLEVDEQNTGRALLIVITTLLDTKEKEITKQIVFQRTYRFEEPLKEQSPEALARGMSNAMARLSEQLLKDLVGSLQRVAK